jgi:catechol 2,3-dioxygenase-like lactoylglutathione lyase family enzyme
MKINKLDHVSIGTNRLEETRAFFCDLLGLNVGRRPALKSVGYWLYAGDEAIIHLVEKGSNADEAAAYEDGKHKPKEWDRANSNDMVETGMDDHIALTVEKSADLV